MEVSNDKVEATALSREMRRAIKQMPVPEKPGILTLLTDVLSGAVPDYQMAARLIGECGVLSQFYEMAEHEPAYKIEHIQKTIEKAGAIKTLGLSYYCFLRHAIIPKESLSRHVLLFWENVIKVANFAEILTKTLKLEDIDDIFIFCVLKDCGVPLMTQQYPEYPQILAVAKVCVDRPFTEVEDDSFPLNHAVLGFSLANSWGVSPHICSSILYHHQFSLLGSDSLLVSKKSKILIALAILAERILQLKTNKTQTMEWLKGEKFVRDTLNLSSSNFDDLMELS